MAGGLNEFTHQHLLASTNENARHICLESKVYVGESRLITMNSFAKLPNKYEPDPAVCPLCGKPNLCAVAADPDATECWCEAVEFPEELLAQIPDDGANVIRSLNRGIPLVMQYPRSPATKAIQKLASTVAQMGAMEASGVAAAQKSKKSKSKKKTSVDQPATTPATQ